ncbi:MAG: hypothetical protein U0176_11980 [Bacteroidia bacterium]
MAIAHTPFPISGRVGKMIMTIRNGKQFVHQAPGYAGRHQKRMADPRLTGYQHHTRAFGQASSLSTKIYRSIRPHRLEDGDENIGAQLIPYPQNRITTRIYQAGVAGTRAKISSTTSSFYATEYRIRDIAPYLRGMDLGLPEAPNSAITIQPLGPGHDPDAIRIRGIQEAAKTISIHGNSRIEFRVHIRRAEIQEMIWRQEYKRWRPINDVHTRDKPASPRPMKPSAWIPVDILPPEGLRIPIPRDAPEATIVTSVVIEWREIRPVGNKTIYHHRKGIVRIVACHAPAQAWTDGKPAAAHLKDTHHHLPAAYRSPDPISEPKQIPIPLTPAEQIAQALAHMRPSSTPPIHPTP